MSKIKAQRPQVNIQEGEKTYDNQTEEIQQSQRTPQIETTGLQGHVCYWDTELEGICNYGGCLQGDEGDWGAYSQSLSWEL